MESSDLVWAGGGRILGAFDGFSHLRGREGRVGSVKGIINLNVAKRSPIFFTGFVRFCICILTAEVFRDLLRIRDSSIPE